MRRFEVALEEVRKSLLEMSALVEITLGRSVLALSERDGMNAQEVFRNEKRINRMEIDIDEAATALLATGQPVARDLRLLTTVMKTNSELERVGDEAVNIAQRCQLLIGAPPVKLPVDILQMAHLVQSMVRESLDSFARSDALVARHVLESDDLVDQNRDFIHRELVVFMERHPGLIPQCVYFMFIAQSLERIADHATNIAEDTLFLVEGIEVRHHFQIAV